ncbi:MAG: hypothetical protein IH933_00820 [Euryarchaeota archaeon]|nr:hypothetical protein [Euryarchaeota archaeon]
MGDVEEMTRTNLHRSVFRTMDTMVRTQEGWFSETLNYTQPEDPHTSPLSNAVWSVINRSIFEGIQNGDSATSIEDSTRSEADDYLTEVMDRYVQQAHENLGDIYYMWLIFGSEDGEGDYIEDGEEFDGDYSIDISDENNG